MSPRMSFLLGFLAGWLVLVVIATYAVWRTMKDIERVGERLAEKKAVPFKLCGGTGEHGEGIHCIQCPVAMRDHTPLSDSTLPPSEPEKETVGGVASISEAVESILAPGTGHSATYGHDAKTHSSDDDVSRS